MKESPLTYRILRPILSTLFKIIVRPKIYGKENIPKEGRCVLLGNHTSFWDCFAVICSTKRCLHFLCKVEMFKGLLKKILLSGGIIPVDRSRAATGSLASAIKYLKMDAAVAIFPEGTTKKAPGVTLLPFKAGAAKMVIEGDAPVVPFVITGSFNIFTPRPEIRFYPPMRFETDDIRAETEKMRNFILEKVQENTK